MSNNWDNEDNFSENANDPGPFTRADDYGGGGGYRGGGYGPPQQEMEFRDWVIFNIVMLIPCVNIIMLLIWAFSKDNKTRSDFCKAYLVVHIGLAIIMTIMMFIFGALIVSIIPDILMAF